MEIFALIVAIVALLANRGISARLRGQEALLADLSKQIEALKSGLAGSLPELDTPPVAEDGKDVVSAPAASEPRATSAPLGEAAPLAKYARSAALRAKDQKATNKPARDIWARAEPSPSEQSDPEAIKETAPNPGDQKPPQPPAAPSGPPAGSGWESLIGGQWAVWVGGIALALGGIFMVRYSIEAGLLGPRVRLGLATLFGVVLLGAGEYFRRRSTDIPIARINSAYVPGILTAAGSLVLFAVIYAAYAVLGLAGPALAFVLMGIVSLATLGLALLHGPSLAALGLLGSYVTPILVSTSQPNYAALFLFLLVVTSAALALARLRQWVWMVTASAVGALGWAAMSVGIGGDVMLQTAALKVYLVVLGAGFPVLGLIWRPVDRAPPGTEADGAPVRRDIAPQLAAILAALGLVIALYAEQISYAPAALAVAAMVILSAWICAWLRARYSLFFTIGAATGLLVFAGWSLFSVQLTVDILSFRMVQYSYASVLEPTAFYILASLVFVTATIGIGSTGVRKLTGAAGFDAGAIWWALPVALVPIAAYGVAWISLGADSTLWQLLLGILGAAALGLGTEWVLRRAPQLTSRSMTEVLPLTCMAGGAAALAIAALGLYFDGAMMVVQLSLLALAMSGLSLIRPIKVLRYAAAGAVAMAIVRVGIDPALGLEPSPRIIFNSILPAYGLPVLVIGAACWLLAKGARDAPQRFLEGAAVLFGALLFTLEIRHGMNGGDIYADRYTLGEQAGHTITALVLSGAMMRLDDRAPSPVFRGATQLLGYLSLAMVILSHGFLLNPFITNEATGTGWLFNLLLIAYLVPGLAAAGVHWLARSRRSIAYVTVLEATAWLLLSGFVALTIRRIFVGENIGARFHPVDIGEAYTHSLAALTIVLAVTLAYGRAFADWKSRALPVALGLAIAIFVGANFIRYMPYQFGLLVGEGGIFNLLLPGFLAPAALLLALRYFWKSIDDWQIPQLGRLLGGLALISVFAWATFMVRHAWHGANLYLGPFYKVETYAYSAVWLILGVAILALSGWRNSRDLRIASAAVILATVAKVFLFDMSALEGVLRALSFIGLGVVLIGIGLFYQHLERRVLVPDNEGLK